MTIRQRLVDFLGLRRSMVGLLGMVVLLGMGEKMAERFLPLYLIALGSSTLWPGFLNALDNLLSALYSFPGGWLADRLGVKRSLLLFNVLAMSGFVVVIAIPRWEAVIAGSFLFLSWTAISLPATMSLVATSLPKEKRVMGVSVHSLVRRIPMALGPVCGGIFIDQWGPVTGVRVAFVAALLMAMVALVAQQKLIVDDQPAAPSEHAGGGFWAMLRAMRPELKTLLVGLGKAPVFAIFIALIACRMGLSVTRDARSVGANTTSTVVQSLVAIIILNAIFAISFVRLGI